jgi:hypothetical protein
MHGQQEGSAYNDTSRRSAIHPLFLFNDRVDCSAAKLRPGHASKRWTTGGVPRGAAFARPAIFEALETCGWGDAGRIRGRQNLELAIEDALFRRPGRRSRTPLARYRSLQADSRTTVLPGAVAKVAHRVGDLFPPVGFVVTIPHSQIAPSCGFTTTVATAEQRSRRRAGDAPDTIVVSLVPRE